MMQSLLLNGAASLKGSDLKAQDENNNRVNSLNDSKLAEQQKRFAKVMQDNIDKERARVESRDASKAQVINNNDVEVRDKRDQNTATSKNEKKLDSSDSRLENTGKKEDKKSVAADNESSDKNNADNNENLEAIENADGNDLVEENEKLVNKTTGNGTESENSDFNELLDSSILKLDSHSKFEANAESDIEVDSELLTQLSDEMTASEDEVSMINEGKGDTEIQLNTLSVQEDSETVDSDVINITGDSIDLASSAQVVDTNLLEESDQDADMEADLDLLGQNPLLSQIEAAQQADTKVKNKEEGDSSELSIAMLQKQSSDTSDKKIQLVGNELGVNSELENATDSEIESKVKLTAELESGLKNKTTTELDAKVDIDTEKQQKIKLETGIQLTKESDQLAPEADLDTSVETLKSLEKTEPLSTLVKNETTTATQAVVDVNGARPNQTSQMQLDKLVAFNQQAPAANNLLQEPLDIQSKHAAAMMGERVMMMLSQGKQEVEIRLDPAELGSMMIKMQVKQDQVQLHIQTQAGLSKDIIEQNMPRLREQLAQQGIQLSEANVQQQSQQQSQQQQRQGQINTGTGQLANSQEVVNDQKNVFIPSKIPSLEQGIDYYV